MSSASPDSSLVDHEIAFSPVPRHHASHFEKHKTAFEEGGGRDDAIMEGESVEMHEDDEKASEV